MKIVYESDSPQIEKEDKRNAVQKFCDSLNIGFTSYGFILQLFPVYEQLEQKTTKACMRSVNLGLFFSFTIYVTFSVLAFMAFGYHIQIDIFENISYGPQTYLDLSLKLTFIIIFACNIPFLFMVGKESLLTFILEVVDQEISFRLGTKMQVEAREKLLPRVYSENEAALEAF